MKKILFVLMTLLVTAPVFGAGVAITLTQKLPDANTADPCVVVLVNYANTDPQHVRAFGLNINLGAGADANITAVKCVGVNGQYKIYPGTIGIDSQGNITAVGTCLCNKLHAGTPPSKAVTIELGSLGVVPADSNVLAEITIRGYAHVDVNTTLNAIRGGIVMEDAAAPTGSTMGSLPLDLPLRPVTECINSGAAEHADWVAWGKPDCWCYARQCRGDINGKLTLGKWVQALDLTAFRAAFGLADVDLAAVPNGICADLNHKATLGKRVQALDLTIFRTYFGVDPIPTCDQAPIITGPYNLPWKTPAP